MVKKTELGTPKRFKLTNHDTSKATFIAEGLEEADLDKILEIETVSETVYNKKTKTLTISYNKNIPLVKLFEEIKLRIPQATFYKISENQQENGTLASTIIQDLLKKGDNTVLNLTKGHADSQDLIFISTLGMALEELMRNPIMPKWYDWLRFSQGAYTNIRIKQEQNIVEEEIKLVDEDVSKVQQINAEDIKKLITSIEELKCTIEKYKGEAK